MTFVEEKLNFTENALKSQIATEKFPIEKAEFIYCGYKSGTTPPDKAAAWQDFKNGDVDLGYDGHCWVHFTAEVPECSEFDRTFLCLDVKGYKGIWDATNPQFLVYVDGEAEQAFDTHHHNLLIGSGSKDIYVYCYSGMEYDDDKWKLNLKFSIQKFNKDIERLYYDFAILNQSLKALSKYAGKGRDSYEYNKIFTALDHTSNLLDLRDVYSENYFNSIERADKYLREEFYDKLENNSYSEISYVGHTHIDIAWLWSLAQTREKAQRSFATVIKLMDEFDDYVFMSSQPELYKCVKEEDPVLYNKIKEKVAEGRWEVEGGMWLESDTNMPCGESLVRQFLYGKKFMKEEFGKESRCLWLPDVFGYSGALPQIMRKCGIDRFYTAKISWNETNSFPHDIFIWQGIDGSEVLSMLINNYVNDMSPDNVLSRTYMFKDKKFSSDHLEVFGWADGGGGPSRRMLENLKRFKKGIPGFPKFRVEKSQEAFDYIEKQFKDNCKKHSETPKWKGELYLEKHRGTYTTMAQNKKFNRKSEFLYMDTETAGVMAELLTGKEYPVKELNDGWYIINLNQFHDIIPGSSVEPVYEVSHKQYREITEMGEKLISERLSALKENIETDGGYFVYNPTSFEFSGVTTCGKEEIFVKNIPAHGYAVVKANNYENSFLKAENGVIENDKLKVTFDEKFNIISILDKENEREVIKSGEKANSLEIFEDHPHDFDAWDIDEPYKQKKWIIDDVSSAEFFKNALSCGVKIKRKYNKSVIEQNIILKAGSNRLDFETAVDWKESHILLKTAFPFDINAMNAEYEIQYGHLSRPNHTNTSWDEAKFEVCAQKWADLSDNNYGVALINDCKYGYSTEENVMKLTLLRAPKYPNKNADIGTHRFSYSIFPHTGKDVDGGVIKESFFFNNPVKVSKIEKQSGKLPSSFCFAKTDREAVVIDAVKKAEDQNGVIIRAYDSFGSKTKCKFDFGKEIKKVYLCDMLENNLKEIEVKDNSFTDIFETFGINTYRIIF